MIVRPTIWHTMLEKKEIYMEFLNIIKIMD